MNAKVKNKQKKQKQKRKKKTKTKQKQNKNKTEQKKTKTNKQTKEIFSMQINKEGKKCLLGQKIEKEENNRRHFRPPTHAKKNVCGWLENED